MRQERQLSRAMWESDTAPRFPEKATQSRGRIQEGVPGRVLGAGVVCSSEWLEHHVRFGVLRWAVSHAGPWRQGQGLARPQGSGSYGGVLSRGGAGWLWGPVGTDWRASLGIGGWDKGQGREPGSLGQP